MSRPFSYNDENFNVIGNILFVHIKIGSKAYQSGDKIITIPKGIYNRMLSYNNQAILSNNYTKGPGALVGITCSDTGNLIVLENINSEIVYLPRYLYTFYVLKDI